MNVTTSFLHNELEEIIIKQLESFEVGQNEVCLIKKSYGLKK